MITNEVITVGTSNWKVRQARSHGDAMHAIATARASGSVASVHHEEVNGVKAVVADVVRLKDDGTEADAVQNETSAQAAEPVKGDDSPATQATSSDINPRMKAEAIASWLGHQHEDLSYGLRSVADAERLYDYWQNNPELPEFADEEADDEDVDVSEHRIAALGYDPLAA